MQKGGLALIFLSVTLGIMFLNFASAQVSLGDFFNSIGADNISLLIIFGLSGLLAKWALSRSMGPGSSMPGILAMLIAFGITAAAHFTGIAYTFDLNSLFYDLGVSETMLFYIVPLLFLGLIIFFTRKFNFGAVLAIVGIGLFLTGWLTDFFYEYTTVMVIGIIMFLFGLWLWRRHSKKKDMALSGYSDYPYSKKPGFFRKGAGWAGSKAWGGAKATGRGIKKGVGWTTGKDIWKQKAEERKAYEEELERQRNYAKMSEARRLAREKAYREQQEKQDKERKKQEFREQQKTQQGAVKTYEQNWVESADKARKIQEQRKLEKQRREQEEKDNAKIRADINAKQKEEDDARKREKRQAEIRKKIVEDNAKEVKRVKKIAAERIRKQEMERQAEEKRTLIREIESKRQAEIEKLAKEKAKKEEAERRKREGDIYEDIQ
ncbi:hypothetical protein COU59_00705 [Candidatus Pacearchaeota archaeon CG10_big_fil_rev_8_21_14_0_10_34_12]|nr:MAG: hypothetical protein COU59_00705 [Candidatus Pacearchaeota archaeon CG10_big_fil_rev_8_21_14_0_10_34_12]